MLPLTPSELAQRLHTLFTHVHPAQGEYLADELVAVTNIRAGDSTQPVLSIDLVEQLRRGASVVPLPAQLDAIARFFGVPTGYLTGAISGRRIEAQLQLLVAVREWSQRRRSAVISGFAGSISPLRISIEDDGGPHGPTCVRLAWPWSSHERGEIVVGASRGRARSERDLLRRCGNLAHEIDQAVGIPQPFDLEVFIDRLAQYRGRPIDLVAFGGNDELPGGTCGFWVEHSDRDVIGYPIAATRTHRDHIVLHECGHIMAKHKGTVPIAESTILQLMPDLDPDMVRTVLGRSVYSAQEEQEAEIFASLIMQRSFRSARPSGWQDDLANHDEVAARVERTFGFD